MRSSTYLEIMASSLDGLVLDEIDACRHLCVQEFACKIVADSLAKVFRDTKKREEVADTTIRCLKSRIDELEKGTMETNGAEQQQQSEL